MGASWWQALERQVIDLIGAGKTGQFTFKNSGYVLFTERRWKGSGRPANEAFQTLFCKAIKPSFITLDSISLSTLVLSRTGCAMDEDNFGLRQSDKTAKKMCS